MPPPPHGPPRPGCGAPCEGRRHAGIEDRAARGHPQPIEQIIQRLRDGTGSEESFRTLFDRFYWPLFRFFEHRGFSTEECQDLIQETFLRVYRGIEAFRGEARWEHWLFRIAANRNEAPDRLPRGHAARGGARGGPGAPVVLPRCTGLLRELRDFEAAAAGAVEPGPEPLRQEAWESLARRLAGLERRLEERERRSSRRSVPSPRPSAGSRRRAVRSRLFGKSRRPGRTRGPPSAKPSSKRGPPS